MNAEIGTLQKYTLRNTEKGRWKYASGTSKVYELRRKSGDQQYAGRGGLSLLRCGVYRGKSHQQLQHDEPHQRGPVNAYGGSSADFAVRGGVLEKYNGAAMEVVIPNSVKIIGDQAFYNCKGITSVVIPDSVKEIGRYAFNNCAELESVTMANSVQKIGYCAFRDCRSLTALTIPDSVREIDNDAFAGCSALTAIVIPASVQLIGIEAFYNCKSLRTVEFKGNPQCYSGAFSGTPYQEAKEREARRQWEAKRRQEAEQKSGCYIATAVYGSYDCPEVWTLRRFRDNTLDRTWYGRAFIRTYYAVSPTLVRWFGKGSWFQALFRPMLDRLVVRLQQNGVEDTAYQDKY